MGFPEIFNRAKKSYLTYLEADLKSVFDAVCLRGGMKLTHINKDSSLMGIMLYYDSGDKTEVVVYAYPKQSYKPYFIEIERTDSSGTRLPNVRTDDIKEAQRAVREMRGKNAGAKKDGQENG